MQCLKLISLITILCIGPSIHAEEIDIFKGMKLYAENCAGCHMGNLAGHEEWNKSLDEDGHRRAPPLNGTVIPGITPLNIYFRSPNTVLKK